MRNEYYTRIHLNPHIRLNWFLPMIRRAEATGERLRTAEPVPLRGLDYTLLLSPEIWREWKGRLTLLLRWEDDGETHEQRVPITGEGSNLVEGSLVYYFMDGRGHKCRKLWYIGGRWRSRETFRHTYGSRSLSRNQRATRGFSEDEPYKPYGKRLYRGRLTPYGKRCNKYEDRQDKALLALASFVGRLTHKNK